MRIFHNRPLALAACVLVLTAVCVADLPGNAKLAGLACALLGAGLLTGYWLCRKRCGRRCATVLLCLLGAATALASSWLFFDVSVGRIEKRAGQICTAEGVVERRLNAAAQNSRFFVMLSELDGERIHERVLLECPYSASLQAGDRIRLTATVRQMKDTEDYQERQILFADGCAGVLHCGDYRDCTVYPGRETPLRIRLADRNAELSLRLRRAVGGEEGALAAALLLGNRSAISDDTVLQFRRAGISHLLALSGLHVSVLVGIMEFLLRRLRVPKQVRDIFIPLSALGYLGLTGGAVSTVRAVAMVCVLYIAFLFQESYDPFTALSTVLALIVTVTPYAVADVSLWMSFAASAAIIVFVPAVREHFNAAAWAKRLPGWLVRMLRGGATVLAVGLFANAAVSVISAKWFGSTSVFSVPVTILLSPLLTPALLLSVAALLFPQCAPLLWGLRLCLKGMLWAAERVSDVPNAIVLLGGVLPSILTILTAAVLILSAVLPLRRKGWILLAPVLSAAVLFAGYADAFPRSTGTAVTYVRKGENEGLLFSEGHCAVAVDCSDGSASLGAALADAAEKVGCTELSELIFTHYHSKMSYLIASLSSAVKLRAVRFPEPVSEQERAIAARLEQEAGSHGVHVTYGGRNTALSPVEILEWTRTDSPNIEVPVLLMLRVRGRILTYIGSGLLDSALREQALYAVRSAEVLIVGCHGTVPKTGQELPVTQGASLVIYGSGSLRELYPAPVDRADPVADVDFYRFFLK